MDQEPAPIEHPVTDEAVVTACQIGIGSYWHKMSDKEKEMWRGYFRQFLKVYGVRHKSLTEAPTIQMK